ncbi:MAG: prolipoprotein diacylglyceryl transferase [Spirochaetales bacterium]|nr:prolipoprotein diacylglyceryl transferase [Spirochaetales bacterium]
MLNYIKFPDWLKPEIIPGLMIRWYALMYIIAFTITYLLFRYQQKYLKMDYKEDDVLNLFVWGIVGLILGARIFAITVYDVQGSFIKNPIISFLPIDCEGGKCTFTGFQGMSYHGGVIGCFLGILIYTKIKKINFLEWGDLIVAGIPLGYTFGRLGNFINGELFGRVTTLPWGIQFPGARSLSARDPWVKEAAEKIGITIPENNLVNLPRHPSQLYEAFFEGIVIWAILWFIFRKRKPFNGFIIAVYLICYGTVRFILEYFRQPDIGRFLIEFGSKNSPIYRCESLFNFTIGQLLCFFMIAGGIVCLIIFSRIEKNRIDEEVTEKPDIKKLKKMIK